MRGIFWTIHWPKTLQKGQIDLLEHYLSQSQSFYNTGPAISKSQRPESPRSKEKGLYSPPHHHCDCLITRCLHNFQMNSSTLGPRTLVLNMQLLCFHLRSILQKWIGVLNRIGLFFFTRMTNAWERITVNERFMPQERAGPTQAAISGDILS